MERQISHWIINGNTSKIVDKLIKFCKNTFQSVDFNREEILKLYLFASKIEYNDELRYNFELFVNTLNNQYGSKLNKDNVIKQIIFICKSMYETKTLLSLKEFKISIAALCEN